MEYSVDMIDFYEQFYDKYTDYIKPEITAIVMIQTDDTISLEVHYDETTKEGYEKIRITRSDLDFIVEEESGETFFRLDVPIEVNVGKFLNELSPYSIICISNLFKEEAAKRINSKYCIFGVDK